MRGLVRRFLDDRQITGFQDLEDWGYSPTRTQRDHISKRINRIRNPVSFLDALTDKFVADKFGEATTHWDKLEQRVQRGVGNPCPLLLIGLPDTIVTFHEGQAALKEIETESDNCDE